MIEHDPGLRFWNRLPSYRPEKRRPELFGRNTGKKIGRKVGEMVLGHVRAREGPAGPLFHGAQRMGGVAKRLVLEQLRQKQVAFLQQPELFVHLHADPLGQQASKFEFDQRRRDQEELSGDVEVEGLHLIDFVEKGVDDAREADLIQIDLLFGDQVQQKVEGPLIDRGRNCVCHNVRILGVAEGAARPKLSTLMARVLSCIQPTGEVTLGNYFGAVKRWVEDQSPDSFHGIVDLHALTVPQDPATLLAKTSELATILLAAGLDPAIGTIFVQGHVREHSELGWLITCSTGIGELERMTQFKDKSARHGTDFVSAGLLVYPSLMAADILLYDAEEVPVGDDQRQHLELCRDVAQRFNSRYGETFVVPKGTIPKVGARIMDLQEPRNKMSKSSESELGTIRVLDDPKTIEKKIKRAVTDTDGEVRFDVENKPGVSNLLSILAVSIGEPDPATLAGKYTQYGPLKADTAAALIECLRPMQTRYAELTADPGFVRDTLDAGAHRAELIASATLARARKALGLLPRY